MSKRDEYIPTVSVSNTDPPRQCSRCLLLISGVFYVRKGKVLCATCRP